MKENADKKADLIKLTKLKGYLKTDKGRKMIIIIGIAGMALILLSGILPRQPSKSAKADSTVISNSQYEKLLEQRLATLISGIEGAGQTSVLVTLENGEENIYAVNTDENSDNSREQSSDYTEKEQISSDSKRDIVVIKQDGDERPVITTTIEPKIKGVVVVCQGGGTASVKGKISEAVTTALNISSNRVCVIKSD